MRRFQGEALPPTPRIALVSNDALGNYVVLTPLIQMLRARYPDAELSYFGGSRTSELWREETAIDRGMALFGPAPSRVAAETQRIVAECPYDLVVNVEAGPWARCFAATLATAETAVVGPCLGPDGRRDLPFPDDSRGRLWQDPAWIAPDLAERYPFLRSSFIGEIFCRLCYLDGPVPGYRLARRDPAGDVPDVLIATAASLPEKLWTVESWAALVQRFRRQGLRVGLLGAPPSSQRQFWKGAGDEEALVEQAGVEDLRGRFSLPEVVGALARAKRVVTLDNGILHLAAATATPTVGLFRHGIHRLWTPPSPNVRPIVAAEGGRVEDISVAVVSEAADIGT